MSMHVTSISDGEKPERADVLERQRQREQAAVVAAVLLRHQAPEQADVRELLPQLVVELVVAMRHLAPLLLAMLVLREHLPDGAAQQLVFFGDLEVHGMVRSSSSIVGSRSPYQGIAVQLFVRAQSLGDRRPSRRETAAPCTPQWPSCLLHDVDRVVLADRAAVLAVAPEARVEVHLVRRCCGGCCAAATALWCQPVAAMRSNRSSGCDSGALDDADPAAGDPHRRIVERRRERLHVARVPRAP